MNRLEVKASQMISMNKTIENDDIIDPNEDKMFHEINKSG